MLGVVLWDTFETIVLPRTVRRQVRLASFFFVALYGAWSYIAQRMRADRARREFFLGTFAPAALLLLLATWALLLIVAFALLHWGAGSDLHVSGDRSLNDASFGVYLYLSGVTLFTLGFGDVSPTDVTGRLLAVVEAGLGFGFLAAVIGYLPVMYESFSRREKALLLLNSRLGTPPTACGLLAEYGRDESREDLDRFLRDAHEWAAELLHTYTSYPIVAFYRSQHDEQSWLLTLTAVLDSCALLDVVLSRSTSLRSHTRRQAQLTFKLSRHVLRDFAKLINVKPVLTERERLDAGEWRLLCARLAAAGVPVLDEDAEAQLAILRGEYEALVSALAQRLLLDLPPWSPPNELMMDRQPSL